MKGSPVAAFSSALRPRLAEPDDISAIARVHVQAWRETYRGIVPDAFLQTLSEARRESTWQQAVMGEHRGGIYVTDPGGTISGFANGGPSRSQELPFTGELYALYVLEGQHRRGLGRSLFLAVVDYLLSEGHHSMLLWVLRDNPAVGFYEKMGGVPVAEAEIEIGGANLVEVALGWNDLPALRAPRH